LSTLNTAPVLGRRVGWFQLLLSTAALLLGLGLPLVTTAFAWAQRMERVETQLAEARGDTERLPEILERLGRLEEDVHWLRRDREREERLLGPR